MRRRRNFLASFFILFAAGIVLFLLWQFTPVKVISVFMGRAISSAEFSVITIFTSSQVNNNPEAKLANQNKQLLEKLAKFEILLKENNALLDQFQTVYPRSDTLLPAEIVAKPSFVPGITSPLEFILNKGKIDGVKKGQAVIFKSNLVGEIQDTNEAFSVVSLVTSNKFSITAHTLRSGALGVVRGEGASSISFNNILPSADLKEGDIVVSTGSLDTQGVGIPPDLIVGKIVSIIKNPSAIFQTAEIESLVDFSKLSMVFIITKPR